MIAKYDDRCGGCDDPIAKGDEVHWSAEDGVRCLECGPVSAGEPRGALTGREDAPGYVRVLEKRIAVLEQTVVNQADELNGFRDWILSVATELGIKLPKTILT